LLVPITMLANCMSLFLIHVELSFELLNFRTGGGFHFTKFLLALLFAKKR
jgi:hypothetical protein